MKTASVDGGQHRRGRGRTVFWIVVAVMIVGAAWAVTAEQRSPRRGHARYAHAEIGPLELGFVARRLFPGDADARARFGTVAEEALGEARLLRADGDRLHAALIEAVSAGEIDETALAHIRDEAHEVARRAIDASFDAGVTILRELTPDQRRELAAMIRERRR